MIRAVFLTAVFMLGVCRSHSALTSCSDIADAQEAQCFLQVKVDAAVNGGEVGSDNAGNTLPESSGDVSGGDDGSGGGDMSGSGDASGGGDLSGSDVISGNVSSGKDEIIGGDDEIGEDCIDLAKPLWSSEVTDAGKFVYHGKLFNTEKGRARQIVYDGTGAFYVSAQVTRQSKNDLHLEIFAKYNLTGGREWKKTVPQGEANFLQKRVALDTNGSMYVVGSDRKSIFLWKYHAWYNGSFGLQWNESLPWIPAEVYTNSQRFALTVDSVVVDKVGDVVISANSRSLSSLECVLIKYDGSGHRKWDKSFPRESDRQRCEDLATDTNQNIYWLKGEDAEDWQRSLLKLDSSGAIVWSKKPGSNHSISSLAIDAENYIYITGMIWYAIDEEEGMTTTVWKSQIMFLQKYDTFGNLQWETLQSCVGPTDSWVKQTLWADFITIQSDSVLIGGFTTCKCGNQTTTIKGHTVIMNYSSQGVWQGTFELDPLFVTENISDQVKPASWMSGFSVGPSQGLYSLHTVRPNKYATGNTDAYLIKYSS